MPICEAKRGAAEEPPRRRSAAHPSDRGSKQGVVSATKRLEQLAECEAEPLS